MESRKRVLVNQLTESKWRCRHREWTGGYSGGRRGEDRLSTHRERIYTIMCKTDN